jgi:hypothetical protein
MLVNSLKVIRLCRNYIRGESGSSYFAGAEMKEEISDRERELREREQQLEQRALELRLKELDGEP